MNFYRTEERKNHFTIHLYGLFNLQEVLEYIKRHNIDPKDVYIGCGVGGQSVMKFRHEE